MVNGVHRFANAVGLRIDAAKTKALSAEVNPSSRDTITLDGVPLEEVSSFKYLGASVAEITAKINLLRANSNRLHTSMLAYSVI